jgi:hypothetical protein
MFYETIHPDIRLESLRKNSEKMNKADAQSRFCPVDWLNGKVIIELL